MMNNFSRSDILPLIACLLMPFVLGINAYTVANHSTYILPGIMQAEPTLWAFDWYTQVNVHYHILFTYLISMLQQLGVLTPGLLLLQYTFVAATCWLLYKLVQSVTAHAQAIFYLLLAIFVVCDGTISVGLSYLLSDGIQPSSIAAFGFLWAIVLFIQEKYVKSSVALFIFASFHVNFLLLAFPYFGLAHIFLGKKYLLRRLFEQFTLPLISFLCFVPLILNAQGVTVSSEELKLAYQLMYKVRAAHHYDLASIVLRLIHLSLILSITWVMSAKLIKSGKYKAVNTLWLSGVALFLFSILEALLVGNVFIQRLFIWRLAPYTLMLSYLLILLSVPVASNHEGTHKIAIKSWAFLALCLCCLLLVIFYAVMPKQVYLAPVAALIITALGMSVTASRLGNLIQRMLTRHFVKLSFALLLIVAASASLNSCKFYWLKHCDKEKLALFTAMKANMDINAIALTPPRLESARLLSQRAIVIDWKDVPLVPQLTLEWFERLQMVTSTTGDSPEQFTHLVRKKQLDEFYHRMDGAQLRRIQQRYDVHYLVVDNRYNAKTLKSLKWLENVYNNKNYTLYKINARN